LASPQVTKLVGFVQRSPSMPESRVMVQPCQSCRQILRTKLVSFQRNVGMIFMRRTYKLTGNLCESCIHKHFWQFQALDLLLGPWGTISLIITPIYFIQNIVSYAGALYAFRQPQTAAELPQS